VAAAYEQDLTITVGDSVFVHPNERTPHHMQGIQGTVVAVDGDEAELQQRASGEVIRVEVRLLHRDRRRPRVRARWDIAS
jgi:hypothetical protein